CSSPSRCPPLGSRAPAWRWSADCGSRRTRSPPLRRSGSRRPGQRRASRGEYRPFVLLGGGGQHVACLVTESERQVVLIPPPPESGGDINSHRARASSAGGDARALRSRSG